MAEKTEETKQEAKAVAKVKVRCLMPFENPNTKQVMLPGQTCDLSAEQAAEFTRDFGGGAFAFRGERFQVDGDVKRHPSRRAEVVAA
jgi:hypothetical protein